MVAIEHNGNKVYSISENLYQILLRVKEKVNTEDTDYLIAFSGDTGCGKSLAAMKWGYVIDPSLGEQPHYDELTRICFNKQEFVEAILEGKKGQVIIGDEAISLFFSRAAMTKENRIAIELMNQIRQKNLVVILCVPNLLTLDTLILEKLNMCCHIWESREKSENKTITIKGNQACYINFSNQKYKQQYVKQLVQHLKIKRRNPMAKTRRPRAFHIEKGNPISQIPTYPVNERKYREKKEAVLKKYKEGDKKEDRNLILRNKAISLLHKGGLSERKIAKEIGLSPSTIHNAIQVGNDARSDA